VNTAFFVVISVVVFAAGFALGLAYHTFYKKNTLRGQNNLLKKELEELSRQIQDIEFTQSKFILNPHLFKNTLNSIQSYAFRTHQSLEKLSGVLDYILYDSNTQLISVKEELDFVRNFIDLNKIKLNPIYDIRVKIRVDEHNPLYTQQLLTPLITAYFIENAFKHADLQSPDAFISILFELKDSALHFSVSNKISQTPIFKGKGGIGKASLKKRLDLTYGNCYQLDYTEENHIYTSQLKINLVEFKSKMFDIG
jgi:LytS/YehU family sensor histidine kinase